MLCLRWYHELHLRAGECREVFDQWRIVVPVRHDRDVRRMAYTDSLTGLMNRRAFTARATDERGRKRDERPNAA